nr:fimbria/pilus outer membrane usher protein [uncultured Moellerella sp.]
MKSFWWYHGLILSGTLSYAHAQDNMLASSSLSSAHPVIDDVMASPSQTAVSASRTTKTAEINFDVDALRALGYGTEVAEFFKQGSQFLPGQHDVTLIVNGSARYSATVLVGEQGQLCMTPSLQQTLKLRTKPITSVCTALDTLYPDAQVTPHPNNATFDILVTENTFDPQLRGDELTYGGFALLTNYRVYGIQMKGTDTEHFYQGQFESGANWQNWILRNNSSFSSGKNSTLYQFNETTLGHSISPWRAQLQLGQISTQGSLFGGVPLNGVQLYSDSALQNTNKLVVPISGVAQTPATVEVMQNGRLLYRTLVPAGPFELDRLNGVVSGQPLQVSVLQEDGQRQQFSVVTSQQLSNAVMSEPTYQVAIGQYRKRSGGDRVDTPLIANVEGGGNYQYTDYLAGLQFSEHYQSIGGRLARQWGENQSIGSSVSGQYSRNSDKYGQQWNLSTNMPLGPFSLGISSLYRTRDYPTLDETLQKDTSISRLEHENTSLRWQDSETQTANSASINWGHPAWGRFSYTLGNTHYYGNKPDTVLHTFSYGKKIQNVSLNMSYQGGNDRDNRVFVNVSVPLGRNASFSTQMQRYQKETTLATTFNHRVNNLFGYSLGVSRNSDTQRVNGSVNTTTAYSQLAASGSWSDENTHSMMFSSSGAIAYTDGLLASSPVALGDTFGIIYIPSQSGVQINTMGGGTTVTNHFGSAAIPTLPINRKTTVQLNTKNLPLNIRLETTSFDVAVARGTVISREVSATVMTQLLLGITLSDGTPAPSGSSLVDEQGQLMGIVMGNSNVMLSNEQIGQSVRLRMANQEECLVNYPIPQHFDPNLLYEEVDAICQ